MNLDRYKWHKSNFHFLFGFDPVLDFYTLDIPNKEVRIGLTRSLIPAYITPDTLIVNNAARHVAQCLVKEDINGALTILQKFLSTHLTQAAPYSMQK